MRFGASIVELPDRITSICISTCPVRQLAICRTFVTTRTQQIPEMSARDRSNETSLTACHAPDLISRAVQIGHPL